MKRMKRQRTPEERAEHCRKLGSHDHLKIACEVLRKPVQTEAGLFRSMSDAVRYHRMDFGSGLYREKKGIWRYLTI